MSAPRWAVGMRRLGAGVYVDEKTRALHFNPVEMCDELRVPFTPENAAIAMNAARQAVTEMFPDVTIALVDDRV